MNKGKVKLYCGRFNHYATIWLDEIKNMEQNGAYWFIEMKDGEIYEDCNMAVITSDLSEEVGYFVENS
jgi:hypothetical protein